ncbi:helix-turn-helix domain-containing protein [Mycobacterium sp. TNTM28]|uniref:Helix-turn-helix domain-containing protein n=1 Tax=[Mycobacterium] fortunisiensis TaxID=2600579 RepID=A0ABS6KJK1_9MYCO|nr:helix-turn-helix domain-containing protein [[Mycobacterium] fortunisiensis]
MGRRVGEYRRDRNWTLATLAEKVGLSTTQLSRIESGTRQPSVGTLIQIAHAFGVSLSRLVDEQYTAPYHLTRAADRVPRQGTKKGLTLLSGDFPGLQAVHLTVPTSSDAPDARHSGEEWVYVLTGSVDIRIGTDTITLGAGDAIHFPSHTTHRVHNPGVAPAEILLVATPTTG